MQNNKICKHCKKRFYSTKGKEHCTGCSRHLGLTKRSKTIMKSTLKRVCDDVENYKTDIYLLATKQKWGLISPVDRLRVVSIFMNVICNENKYATKEPDTQVELMIGELVELLKVKIEYVFPGKGRLIVELSPEGKIIRTFPGVRQASRILDYSEPAIRRRCNGGKSNIKENLKWRSEVNI